MERAAFSSSSRVTMPYKVCFIFLRAESDEYGREKVFTCLAFDISRIGA